MRHVLTFNVQRIRFIHQQPPYTFVKILHYDGRQLNSDAILIFIVNYFLVKPSSMFNSAKNQIDSSTNTATACTFVKKINISTEAILIFLSKTSFR
jgi:hypothetical protein